MDELRAVFDQLGKNDLNGLVFDVRDNPGGELSAAIAVTNLFLREGGVVSLKCRKQRSRSWSASADGYADEALDFLDNTDSENESLHTCSSRPTPAKAEGVEGSRPTSLARPVRRDPSASLGMTDCFLSRHCHSESV